MTPQKFEVVAWGHTQPHIDEAQKSVTDAGETFVRSALSYPQFPHPAPHHMLSCFNLTSNSDAQYVIFLFTHVSETFMRRVNVSTV